MRAAIFVLLLCWAPTSAVANLDASNLEADFLGVGLEGLIKTIEDKSALAHGADLTSQASLFDTELAANARTDAESDPDADFLFHTMERRKRVEMLEAAGQDQLFTLESVRADLSIIRLEGAGYSPQDAYTSVPNNTVVELVVACKFPPYTFSNTAMLKFDDFGANPGRERYRFVHAVVRDLGQGAGKKAYVPHRWVATPCSVGCRSSADCNAPYMFCAADSTCACRFPFNGIQCRTPAAPVEVKVSGTALMVAGEQKCSSFVTPVVVSKAVVSTDRLLIQLSGLISTATPATGDCVSVFQLGGTFFPLINSSLTCLFERSAGSTRDVIQVLLTPEQVALVLGVLVNRDATPNVVPPTIGWIWTSTSAASGNYGGVIVDGSQACPVYATGHVAVLASTDATSCQASWCNTASGSTCSFNGRAKNCTCLAKQSGTECEFCAAGLAGDYCTDVCTGATANCGHGLCKSFGGNSSCVCFGARGGAKETEWKGIWAPGIDGTCSKCADGYAGAGCNCAIAKCGPHGHCSTTDDTCVCDSFWVHKLYPSVEEAEPFSAPNWNAGGLVQEFCAVHECPAGFFGANCSCSDAEFCHGHGSCRMLSATPTETYQCTCEDGFNEADNCLTCVAGMYGPNCDLPCDDADCDPGICNPLYAGNNSMCECGGNFVYGLVAVDQPLQCYCPTGFGGPFCLPCPTCTRGSVKDGCGCKCSDPIGRLSHSPEDPSCETCAPGWYPSNGLITSPCNKECLCTADLGGGSCSANGTCLCNDPNFPNRNPADMCLTCKLPHYGYPSCAFVCDPTTTCSGNGNCTFRPMSPCACDTGFTGEDCSVCDEGFIPLQDVKNGPVVVVGMCSFQCEAGQASCLHGMCDDTAGVCTCSADYENGFWTGPHCDTCAVGYAGDMCTCKISDCGDVAAGACQPSGECLCSDSDVTGHFRTFQTTPQCKTTACKPGYHTGTGTACTVKCFGGTVSGNACTSCFNSATEGFYVTGGPAAAAGCTACQSGYWGSEVPFGCLKLCASGVATFNPTGTTIEVVFSQAVSGVVVGAVPCSNVLTATPAAQMSECAWVSSTRLMLYVLDSATLKVGDSLILANLKATLADGADADPDYVATCPANIPSTVTLGGTVLDQQLSVDVDPSTIDGECDDLTSTFAVLPGTAAGFLRGTSFVWTMLNSGDIYNDTTKTVMEAIDSDVCTLTSPDLPPKPASGSETMNFRVTVSSTFTSAPVVIDFTVLRRFQGDITVAVPTSKFSKQGDRTEIAADVRLAVCGGSTKGMTFLWDISALQWDPNAPTMTRTIDTSKAVLILKEDYILKSGVYTVNLTVSIDGTPLPTYSLKLNVEQRGLSLVLSPSKLLYATNAAVVLPVTIYDTAGSNYLVPTLTSSCAQMPGNVPCTSIGAQAEGVVTTTPTAGDEIDAVITFTPNGNGWRDLSTVQFTVTATAPDRTPISQTITVTITASPPQQMALFGLLAPTRLTGSLKPDDNNAGLIFGYDPSANADFTGTPLLTLYNCRVTSSPVAATNLSITWVMQYAVVALPPATLAAWAGQTVKVSINCEQKFGSPKALASGSKSFFVSVLPSPVGGAECLSIIYPKDSVSAPAGTKFSVKILNFWNGSPGNALRFTLTANSPKWDAPESIAISTKPATFPIRILDNKNMQVTFTLTVEDTVYGGTYKCKKTATITKSLIGVLLALLDIFRADSAACKSLSNQACVAQNLIWTGKAISAQNEEATSSLSERSLGHHRSMDVLEVSNRTETTLNLLLDTQDNMLASALSLSTRTTVMTACLSALQSGADVLNSTMITVVWNITETIAQSAVKPLTGDNDDKFSDDIAKAIFKAMDIVLRSNASTPASDAPRAEALNKLIIKLMARPAQLNDQFTTEQSNIGLVYVKRAALDLSLTTTTLSTNSSSFTIDVDAAAANFTSVGSLVNGFIWQNATANARFPSGGVLNETGLVFVSLLQNVNNTVRGFTENSANLSANTGKVKVSFPTSRLNIANSKCLIWSSNAWATTGVRTRYSHSTRKWWCELAANATNGADVIAEYTPCNATRFCSNHGTCDEANALCICDDDNVKGHWNTSNCGKCKTNYYPADACTTFCDAATTCGGHGTCSVNGTCVCHNSTALGRFTGATCNVCQTDYYPAGNCSTPCNAALACNGKGVCNSQGACECFSNNTNGHWGGSSTCGECTKGYFGSNCQTYCNVTTTCGAGPNATCSAAGVCTCPDGFDPTASPSCSACLPGFAGSNCLTPCPGGANNTCSHHGVCKAFYNESTATTVGVCDCHNSTVLGSWKGAYCSSCAKNWYTYDCTKFCRGSITCGGRGSCTVNGTCRCNVGSEGRFAGDHCESCTPGYYPAPGVNGSCTVLCDASNCDAIGGSCSPDGHCVCNENFLNTTSASGVMCAGCIAGWYKDASGVCSIPCSAEANCSSAGQCVDYGSGNVNCSCLADEASGFFTGATCNACISGRFGASCIKTCDTTADCAGHGTCNSEGSCTCDSDETVGFWQTASATSLVQCTTCQPGRLLTSECKVNATEEECDFVGGEVRLGVCSCHNDALLGFWNGSSCSVCQKDFFGPLCNLPCDASVKCAGNGHCDAITAECVCSCNNVTGCFNLGDGSNQLPTSNASTHRRQMDAQVSTDDLWCQLCYPGWFNDDVTGPCTRQCTASAQDESGCYGRGTCSPSTGTCICPFPWTGDNCNDCPAGHTLVDGGSDSARCVFSTCPDMASAVVSRLVSASIVDNNARFVTMTFSADTDMSGKTVGTKFKCFGDSVNASVVATPDCWWGSATTLNVNLDGGISWLASSSVDTVSIIGPTSAATTVALVKAATKIWSKNAVADCKIPVLGWSTISKAVPEFLTGKVTSIPSQSAGSCEDAVFSLASNALFLDLSTGKSSPYVTVEWSANSTVDGLNTTIVPLNTNFTTLTIPKNSLGNSGELTVTATITELDLRAENTLAVSHTLVYSGALNFPSVVVDEPSVVDIQSTPAVTILGTATRSQCVAAEGSATYLWTLVVKGGDAVNITSIQATNPLKVPPALLSVGKTYTATLTVTMPGHSGPANASVDFYVPTPPLVGDMSATPGFTVPVSAAALNLTAKITDPVSTGDAVSYKWSICQIVASETHCNGSSLSLPAPLAAVVDATTVTISVALNVTSTSVSDALSAHPWRATVLATKGGRTVLVSKTISFVVTSLTLPNLTIVSPVNAAKLLSGKSIPLVGLFNSLTAVDPAWTVAWSFNPTVSLSQSVNALNVLLAPRSLTGSSSTITLTATTVAQPVITVSVSVAVTIVQPPRNLAAPILTTNGTSSIARQHKDTVTVTTKLTDWEGEPTEFMYLVSSESDGSDAVAISEWVADLSATRLVFASNSTTLYGVVIARNQVGSETTAVTTTSITTTPLSDAEQKALVAEVLAKPAGSLTPAEIAEVLDVFATQAASNATYAAEQAPKLVDMLTTNANSLSTADATPSKIALLANSLVATAGKGDNTTAAKQVALIAKYLSVFSVPSSATPQELVDSLTAAKSMLEALRLILVAGPLGSEGSTAAAARLATVDDEINAVIATVLGPIAAQSASKTASYSGTGMSATAKSTTPSALPSSSVTAGGSSVAFGSGFSLPGSATSIYIQISYISKTLSPYRLTNPSNSSITVVRVINAADNTVVTVTNSPGITVTVSDAETAVASNYECAYYSVDKWLFVSASTFVSGTSFTCASNHMTAFALVPPFAVPAPSPVPVPAPSAAPVPSPAPAQGPAPAPVPVPEPSPADIPVPEDSGSDQLLWLLWMLIIIPLFLIFLIILWCMRRNLEDKAAKEEAEMYAMQQKIKQLEVQLNDEKVKGQKTSELVVAPSDMVPQKQIPDGPPPPPPATDPNGAMLQYFGGRGAVVVPLDLLVGPENDDLGDDEEEMWPPAVTIHLHGVQGSQGAGAPRQDYTGESYPPASVPLAMPLYPPPAAPQSNWQMQSYGGASSTNYR